MAKYIILIVLFCPILVFANPFGAPGGIQNDIARALSNTNIFISGYIIPFLIALAFVFFVINVFRYFIVGAANEESQKKAKLLAFYSIAALTLIFVFWGIINLLVDGLNIGGQKPPCPDYMRGTPGCP